MEMYADITFAHSNKSEELVDAITKCINEIDEDVDVTVEATTDTQTLIYFMSGSEGRDIVKSVMELLKKLKCQFARGFITGDEDPYCLLSALDGNKITTTECDFGDYEYINELDEDEIPKKHQKQFELGPEAYYNEVFSTWLQGLDKIDGQQDYKEVIDGVISMC
jgi:hypothetical protein